MEKLIALTHEGIVAKLGEKINKKIRIDFKEDCLVIYGQVQTWHTKQLIGEQAIKARKTLGLDVIKIDNKVGVT